MLLNYPRALTGAERVEVVVAQEAGCPLLAGLQQRTFCIRSCGCLEKHGKLLREVYKDNREQGALE